MEKKGEGMREEEGEGGKGRAYRLAPDRVRGSMGVRGPQRSMHLIKIKKSHCTWLSKNQDTA